MEEVEIKPENNLRLLKVFKTLEDANKICEILDANQIAYNLTDSQPPLLLTMDTSKFQWWLMVQEDDLENAMGLIETIGQDNETAEEKETYYLFDFTTDELVQVIENYDEWSDEDYRLSIKILAERGIDYSEEKLEKIKHQRIIALSQPEKGNSGWLTFGWIMAVLGGIFGLIIGWHHKTFMKPLPDGTKVPYYDENTRNTGNKIFIFGFVMTFITIVGIIIVSII